MGKCIVLICMVLFIGCTTGSTLNIVSPSASEDEIRARAQRVTSEKTPPAKEEKAVLPQQSPERPQESVAPEKTNPPKESAMKSGFKEEALINLLEKKGIITRKELIEEIKRLEQRAK
jgi:hypothetical protein